MATFVNSKIETTPPVTYKYSSNYLDADNEAALLMVT